jgi:hypothetical protein
MNQRILFWLCKYIYRLLMTTALVFLTALIMWCMEGAPKHVSPPVIAVNAPDANTPRAPRSKHLEFKHGTRR